jgi:hypothetical protein
MNATRDHTGMVTLRIGRMAQWVIGGIVAPALLAFIVWGAAKVSAAQSEAQVEKAIDAKLAPIATRLKGIDERLNRIEDKLDRALGFAGRPR